MADLLLIRYGEIHLKGQNRPFFERQLMKNILAAATAVCPCELMRDQGRFLLRGYAPERTEELLRAVNRVFGVHSASPATECEPTLEAIEATALRVMEAERPNGGTFKVDARRSDKAFPLTSPELARALGAKLLANRRNLSVDVHDPSFRLYVEVREKAYIYTRFESGAGGMPTGTGGRVMLLLSGGIDSPVAGYLLAKRGVELEAVYFHSPPHTGERAQRKVEDLARVLAGCCGGVRLHVVRFTDVQEKLYTDCRPDYLTILMRRFMMRIAQRLARQTGCEALATGENLGQVASQTLQSLACTDAVCQMPVFRPLIAHDKVEIIHQARAIGTYETSILPYEDCCTVFVPRHPVTRPKLAEAERAEAELDIDAMCQACAVERVTIGAHGVISREMFGDLDEREELL